MARECAPKTVAWIPLYIAILIGALGVGALYAGDEVIILGKGKTQALAEWDKPDCKWRSPVAVTLINVFSVPKGKEDDFVRWWQDVKANITAQQGFISGKFHRSIKPESRYNFINVAVWESEEVYWRAYEKSVTPMKAKLEQMGIEMVPALYNVAFEY